MHRNSFTYPLSDKQFEIYSNLIKSDAMYNTLNAGRQSGKSFTFSRVAATFAVIEKCNILIVAPYSVQVETFYNHIMTIEGINVFVKRRRLSPYPEIVFKSGSVMHFRSADNPNSIRSKSYNYIFIDEAAFLKQKAFDLAISPTLIASGDSCKLFFASTPNGRSGLFYDLYIKGEDPDQYRYTYQYMYYKDNPMANMDIINSEKERMPKELYNQEFLGKFISDGGDVFDNLNNVLVLKSFEKPILNQMYFAGIDFGSKRDRSSITILNQKREMVFHKTFGGEDDESTQNWIIQEKELSDILNYYRPITYAESNGVGDAVIASLKKYYGNIKHFNTSNSSKVDMIQSLRSAIFKEEILLAEEKLIPGLVYELTNYTYSLTKTNKITYHHRENEHDDQVDSLALANYSFENHNRGWQTPNYGNRSKFFDGKYNQPNANNFYK